MISRINPVILTQTRHLTDPPSPPPTIIVKCEIHRQIRCANMKLYCTKVLCRFIFLGRISSPGQTTITSCCTNIIPSCDAQEQEEGHAVPQWICVDEIRPSPKFVCLSIYLLAALDVPIWIKGGPAYHSLSHLTICNGRSTMHCRRI